MRIIVLISRDICDVTSSIDLSPTFQSLITVSHLVVLLEFLTQGEVLVKLWSVISVFLHVQQF